jgi:hypothetical protein
MLSTSTVTDTAYVNVFTVSAIHFQHRAALDWACLSHCYAIESPLMVLLDVPFTQVEGSAC